MKKAFNYFCILLMTAILVSCENEINDALDNQQIPPDIQQETDKAIIAKLGLDISTIVDCGDLYIVEGDIFLMKKYLKEYGKTPADASEDSLVTRQAYSKKHGLISMSRVGNITVGFDSSVPTTGKGGEWRTAVLDAMKAWNEIPGCAVKFVYTTASNPNTKIKYEFIDNPRGITYAGAYAPVNGNPGSQLRVNSEADYILSLQEKTNVVIHEFGHVLGFMHTHLWDKEPRDDDYIHIPGTPWVDNESIMSSDRNRDNKYPGFSKDDILATIKSYPYTSKNKITASVSSATVGNNVTYTLNNLPLSEYSTVTWEAVANVSLVSGQGTAKAVFKTTRNGLARVRAKINYCGYTIILDNSAVYTGEKVSFRDIRTTKNGSSVTTEAYLYVPEDAMVKLSVDLFINSSNENPEARLTCNGGVAVVVNKSNMNDSGANTRQIGCSKGLNKIVFTMSGISMNSQSQGSASVVGIDDANILIGSPSTIGVGGGPGGGIILD